LALPPRAVADRNLYEEGRMPKVDQTLDADVYATVAARITRFYERFPNGRIVTRLVSRDGGEVLFRAAVYRTPDDRGPAATGWAAERAADEASGIVACVESTETAAVGRALTNLGLTAARERASADHLDHIAPGGSRARLGLASESVQARHVGPTRRVTYARAPREVADPYAILPTPPPILDDLARLVDDAARLGARTPRVRRWRMRLQALHSSVTPLTPPMLEDLERIEQRLRIWLLRRPS
jgi:hypothetical protein